MTNEELRAYTNELFDRIDVNKNDALDKDEFRSFTKTHEPGMTEEQYESDWKELDLNADGKVDRDELFKFL